MDGFHHFTDIKRVFDSSLTFFIQKHHLLLFRAKGPPEAGLEIASYHLIARVGEALVLDDVVFE